MRWANVVVVTSVVAAACSATAPVRRSKPESGTVPASRGPITYFYVTNPVDRLPEIIVQLDTDGALRNENARPPVAAFFSVVFRRPEVAAESIVERAEVSPEGRTTLLYGLWLAGKAGAAARIARSRGLPVEAFGATPPDLLTMPPSTPQALDMLWGAFLASGDVAYPRRIIDLLDRPEPTNPDTGTRILLGAARWSLGANAVQHDRVLALVKEEAAKRTGPAKAVLDGILREVAGRNVNPEKSQRTMTKVVTRQVVPAAPAGSFASKPKTIYRAGETYGRVEEEPDFENRIHGLIVVAEPKVWIVNLADKTGRLVTDPGPTFVFRAPVFSADKEQAALRDFEIGQEFAFLRAHGAKASSVVVDGRDFDRWTVAIASFVVTVLTDPGSELPRNIRLDRDGKTIAEVEYLEYSNELPIQEGLFQSPPGIAIVEAR